MKIRNSFEDFTTDPVYLAELNRLYKTPDEVDLVVGVQLDEEYYYGTQVPKYACGAESKNYSLVVFCRTALIVSLFSLFGLGNSDRFSPGYALTRCLLVGTPTNCTVTNALEDLLWEAKDPTNPNKRELNTFWYHEIDLDVCYFYYYDGSLSDLVSIGTRKELIVASYHRKFKRKLCTI